MWGFCCCCPVKTRKTESNKYIDHSSIKAEIPSLPLSIYNLSYNWEGDKRCPSTSVLDGQESLVVITRCDIHSIIYVGVYANIC